MRSIANNQITSSSRPLFIPPKTDYLGRPAVIRNFASSILSARQEKERRSIPGRLIIGFDGLDGSGKTHLVVRELAPALKDMGASVQIARGDWSIVPKAERAADPKTYSCYFNWFRYRERFAPLLDLLSSGISFTGELTGLYDSDSGIADAVFPLDVKEDTIVLAEGLFMNNPIIRKYLDALVFVNIEPRLSLERQIVRDTAEKGRSREEVEDLVNRVFMPAHRLYHKLFSPLLNCDMVFNNNVIK